MITSPRAAYQANLGPIPALREFIFSHEAVSFIEEVSDM